MKKHYHILNGDSLRERFPKEIEGEVIVARECLVDGDVKSDSLDELFQLRAQFIADSYGHHSQEEYYAKTVPEFEKIKNIPGQSTIHLWFEDDLFCQVNAWFVAYLLFNFVQDYNVFWVRPNTHTPFGFGGLNQAELKQVYRSSASLIAMDKMASLWESYRDGNTENLLRTAKELEESYPFILRAVEAHLARIPTESNVGRPRQTLLEIVGELGTDQFGPVFQEFNKRESIYGFGDLQVKRLFDEIRNTR